MVLAECCQLYAVDVCIKMAWKCFSYIPYYGEKFVETLLVSWGWHCH
jgi:hypothetical protein